MARYRHLPAARRRISEARCTRLCREFGISRPTGYKIFNRYKGLGYQGYLEVVTSQTVTLQTQLESLNLDTTQLRASVQLIRALGGGWTSAQLSSS